MLYCGVSERDITPERGMGIPGYFEDRRNQGVLDPLFVKAVALEEQGEACALVVCDTINLDRSDVLAIRKKAQDLCGIAPEKILVWATHTHTGGPTWEGFRSKREKPYLEYLASQAAEAVREVYAGRVPAKIGFASGEVSGISFIRRFFRKDGSVVTNPAPDDGELTGQEGTPDETLTIARIDAASGETLAFLTSFGVHLDTVSGELISADYPAVLAQRIRAEYGDGVKSVFLTGPCGNTNHLNHKDPTTYTDQNIRVRIGNALFEKLRELNAALITREASLRTETRRFLWDLRCVSDEQVAWAQGVKDGTVHEAASKMFQDKLFAEPILQIAARDASALEVEISAVRLGDGWIVAWPAELFVEFGRALRSARPGEKLLIGELSGGTIGCYVATQEAYPRGGYETLASEEYAPEPGCGERIVQETIQLLAQIDGSRDALS